jgi:hypothetical protein
MNTIKDLKTSTTLSPVPPAGRHVPDLRKTAPLALEAAARVKCSMADLGVAGHDDLVVTILGLAIAYTEDHGLDLKGICRRVCPAMFVALADCGAPRSPRESWDPTAFVSLLSAEELGRQAVLLYALLCSEAVDMEFAPHMWLMAAIWVLVALHVLEFGIERATIRFPLTMSY